jgi:hypothetical protein
MRSKVIDVLIFDVQEVLPLPQFDLLPSRLCGSNAINVIIRACHNDICQTSVIVEPRDKTFRFLCLYLMVYSY